MSDPKLRRQSTVSTNSSSSVINTSTLNRGLSRASSADSIFEDVTNRAYALFAVLDEDRKGYLDNQILSKMCDPGLTESQISDLITHLDHDGDGQISAEDFLQGIHKLAKKNSLIRETLRVITPVPPRLDQSSPSSESNRSRLSSEEFLSETEDKVRRTSLGISRGHYRPVRLRYTNRKRLHRRLAAIASRRQKQQLTIGRRENYSSPDVTLINECLTSFNGQEHLYELYHILSSENSSLSRLYETVLMDIIEFILKSRDAQSRVEKQIENERNKHSEAILRLSEELDHQVKSAEETARQKERQLAMNEFKLEIESKSLKIEQLLKRIKSLEEDTQKPEIHLPEQGSFDIPDVYLDNLQTKLIQTRQENLRLEEDLANIRLQLAQARTDLNTARQNMADKDGEMEQVATALFEAIKDNSNLKRKIEVLQGFNRDLYDANDGLCCAMEKQNEGPNKHWNAVDSMTVANLISEAEARRIPPDLVVKMVSNARSAKDALLLPQSPGFGIIPERESFHEDSGLSSLRDAAELESETDNASLMDQHRQIWDKFAHRMGSTSRLECSRNVPSPEDRLGSFSTLTHSVQSYKTKQTDDYDDRPSLLNPLISSDFKNQSPNKFKTDTDEKLRIFRVMLAGDSAVGKTSFLLRLCDDKFYPTASTVAIDIKTRTFVIDGRSVMLQLWDTAGQERFRSISNNFYRKADGILLVYDCTQEATFLHTRQWISAIQDNAGREIPVAVVGNKIDLREKAERQGNRCVNYCAGRKLAQEIGALFFETSAATGEHVDECARELTKLLCAQEDYNLRRPAFKITADSTRSADNRCCK